MKLNLFSLKKLLKPSLAVFLAASLISVFSCSNKNKTTNQIVEEQIIEDSHKRPAWKPTEEKVCIVFGYGYNNEEFIKTEIDRLSENFGLSDGTAESGLIIPYVFPDDFKVGNTGRISSLISKLEDVKVCGLITIGAPEYTNNTLANLREDESKTAFPIYSLFPQDEILAIQATSDFVLDKAVSQSDNISELENSAEEAPQITVNGIEDIIDNAVDLMLETKTPLASNAELFNHVSKVAGEQYSIKRYVDPETGLSSINHFIIEEKK